MILKVGRSRVNGEIPRFVAYKDIKADNDGWYDALWYLPADYDLVYVRIDDKPVCVAWSIGKGWDGLNITEDDRVLYWKRKLD